MSPSPQRHYNSHGQTKAPRPPLHHYPQMPSWAGQLQVLYMHVLNFPGNFSSPGKKIFCRAGAWYTIHASVVL